jgi:hypothetical protein
MNQTGIVHMLMAGEASGLADLNRQVAGKARET